jgi:hypothetical protein
MTELAASAAATSRAASGGVLGQVRGRRARAVPVPVTRL